MMFGSRVLRAASSTSQSCYLSSTTRRLSAVLRVLPYVMCGAAPEVSAWSEDLGGGVVRQTVVTPHAGAMDGSASAFDLSFGQRPPVSPAPSPRASVHLISTVESHLNHRQCFVWVLDWALIKYALVFELYIILRCRLLFPPCRCVTRSVRTQTGGWCMQETEGIPVAPWPARSPAPSEGGTASTADAKAGPTGITAGVTGSGSASSADAKAGGTAPLPAEAPAGEAPVAAPLSDGGAVSATLPQHALWFDLAAVHGMERPLLSGGPDATSTPPLSEEVLTLLLHLPTCRTLRLAPFPPSPWLLRVCGCHGSHDCFVQTFEHVVTLRALETVLAGTQPHTATSTSVRRGT